MFHRLSRLIFLLFFSFCASLTVKAYLPLHIFHSSFSSFSYKMHTFFFFRTCKPFPSFCKYRLAVSSGAPTICLMEIAGGQKNITGRTCSEGFYFQETLASMVVVIYSLDRSNKYTASLHFAKRSILFWTGLDFKGNEPKCILMTSINFSKAVRNQTDLLVFSRSLRLNHYKKQNKTTTSFFFAVFN